MNMDEVKEEEAVLEKHVENNDLIQEKGNSGVWDWIKSASKNQYVKKLVTNTKKGVDRVIVTLDPGMKGYIYKGLDLTVTTDNQVVCCAVREAFQQVFGNVKLEGVKTEPNIAAQPVGYLAAVKSCQERIKKLSDDQKVKISVVFFVNEQFPDQWYNIGCLLLDDSKFNIHLKVFTTAIPVENDIIKLMHDGTSDNYDLKWSGLSVTVGEAVHKKVNWISPDNWQQVLAGTSKKEIVYNSAITLAELYKRKLPTESDCGENV